MDTRSGRTGRVSGSIVTAGVGILGAWLLGALAPPVLAQSTTCASVGFDGSGSNGFSSDASISADGRYVVFRSFATHLVGRETNGFSQVFVRDRVLGTTSLVSVAASGELGNDNSSVYAGRSCSSDGRYVVFDGYGDNLVPGDTNGVPDVFVRDLLTGAVERASVDSSGAQANDASFLGAISADGRYVAFMSHATNLVAGDTNNAWDVFVHDRQTGSTERVSVDSAGVQGNFNSGTDDQLNYGLSISGDGRCVAFWSAATNLVAGDSNGFPDIFVRDRSSGTTERASVSTGGAQANDRATSPWISSDGRYVAFASGASNLVAGDTNNRVDVFVRDRQGGTTERVSLTAGGTEITNGDSADCSMSPDGRLVLFGSNAPNVVAGDTNGYSDIFVRDRQAGTTECVSLGLGNAIENFYSAGPTCSADGRYVAFDSPSTNLVPGDVNDLSDVFVRDREDGTNFTSLCDPGLGGVAGCPCSNPPSGAGRGCENSAATGGATLSAGGAAFLSSDSLVFTTSGEKPTATSVVLQGTAAVANGVTYGQGVRCVGGTLKRLYTKTASAGSITAPNFAGGDPSVSARSAAKGNPISAGQSRWYLVFYRDPTVLGGCPVASTFNATQTGRIVWSP